MHKLLDRQLRRHFGSPAAVPAELRPLIEAVEDAYRQADDDRAMLERSMEMVSYELADRLQRLRGAIGERDEVAHALSLLSATLESTADSVLVVGLDGVLTRNNSRLISHWNVPHRLVDGRDGNGILAFIAEQLVDRVEFLNRMRDLADRPEAERADVIRSVNGRVFEQVSVPHRVGDTTVGRVWTFRDVTARGELEEQLRQSQKMEAVGQLAGGVAHDFNNLLTVIRVHAELLGEQADAGASMRESVDQISQAASRAADLTRQLLAFSRKQVVQPTHFDLASTVTALEPMLRRLIGEEVRIVSTRSASPAVVYADPGHLEQVLVNLVVNSRDAMPRGGRLLIDVSLVEVGDGPQGTRGDRTPPGRYVALQVSDTGVGIPREHLTRVFEPFFTTKAQGKGTGLGLSLVYGIVKQSNGYVWVESEPGAGTTVKIHLPQVDAELAPAAAAGSRPRRREGTETVLVAEDEDSVLALMRKLLQAEGYSVLTARDGTEAIAVESRHRGTIDLLVTDVIMPGLGGRDLAEHLRKVRKGIRVLFVSGYANSELEEGAALRGDSAFLPKPFTGQALAAAVRDVLDRPLVAQ